MHATDRNQRKPLRIVAVLGAFALIAAASGTGAETQDSTTTEWLYYTGTNLHVNVGGGQVGPVGVNDAPCDTDGLGAVRFCAALDEEDSDDLPDRVAIHVRDDWGMRASAVWEFRDAAGNTLWKDAFCGHVNTFVPHSGIGYPDPVELIVYPALVFVDDGPLDNVCGSPGTHGIATVTWKYDAPVFQG